MPQPGLSRRELLTVAAACGLNARAAGAANRSVASAQAVADLPVAGVLLTSPVAAALLDDAALLSRLADLARSLGALLHSPVPTGTRIVYGGQPLGIVLAPEQIVAQHAAQALQDELARGLASQAAGPQGVSARAMVLGMARSVTQARSPAQAREYDRLHGQAEVAFDGAEYRLKQTYSCGAELPSYSAPVWVLAHAQRPLPLILLSHPHEAELRDRLASWSKLPAGWITLQIASPAGDAALFEIPAKLAWSASSKLRRPVRLQLSVEQARVLGGQRPEVIQTLTLGAERSGRIVAWVQRTLNASGQTEEFIEPCGQHTQLLYDPAQQALIHQVAPQNIGPAYPKQGAGSLRGSFAVEVALDELAGLLGCDPLQLRIDNAAPQDRLVGAASATSALGPRARLAACREILVSRPGSVPWHKPRGSGRGPGDRLGSGLAVGALPLVGEGSQPTTGCVLHATRLRIAEGSARVDVLSQHVVLHCDGLPPGLDRAVLLPRLKRSLHAAWQSAFAAVPAYDPQSGRLLPSAAPAATTATGVEGVYASDAAIEIEWIGSSAVRPADGAPAIDPASVASQLEALVACGAAAALANALYHATGYRQRTLPFDRALLVRPFPSR